MKAWVEHYARLIHVEFEWPSDLLPEDAPVEGPAPPVTLDIICKALRKMKRGNDAGPFGVIAETLKAFGEEGITMLRHLTEKAFSEGVTPRDWEESCIINLYKGKGDALDRGSYRDLKLTDQAMKLMEHVLDTFIRRMVNIDAMYNDHGCSQNYGTVFNRGQTNVKGFDRHWVFNNNTFFLNH
jgi:hypothetical protein